MPDNEILELLSKVKLDADGMVVNVEIFTVGKWISHDIYLKLLMMYMCRDYQCRIVEEL